MNWRAFSRKLFFVLFFIMVFSTYIVCLGEIKSSESDTTKSFSNNQKSKFNDLFDEKSKKETDKNTLSNVIAKKEKITLEEEQKKLIILIDELNSLEENINDEVKKIISVEIDDKPIKDFESPPQYEKRKLDNKNKIEDIKLRYDQKFTEQKLLLENKIEVITSQTYKDSLELELGNYINAREHFVITELTTGQNGSLYINRKIASQFQKDFSTLQPVGIYQLLKDGTKRLVSIEVEYQDQIYTSLFDRRLEKVVALKALDAHNRNINVICFNNDGTKFATGSDDKTIKIWDTEKQTVIYELPKFSTYITALSFHPSQQILACGDDDGNLIVYNIDTKTEITRIKAHEDRINSISYNSDGSKILTGSKDKTAKVWKVPNMELLYTLDDNPDEIKYALFNPDGVNLILGCANGIIKIYDSFSGNLKIAKDSNTLFLNGMAISPNGQIIATSGIYSEISLWNAKDLMPILKVDERLSSVITSLSFSIPNGKILIGSTDDSNIYFWKTNSGAFVKKLEGVHNKSITSLDINNDGKILASADENGKVKLWGLSYDQFSEYLLAGVGVVGSGSGSGLPPNLSVDLQFEEPSGNDILDALEEGKITVKIKNLGQGIAKRCAILLSGDYPSGLIIRNRTIVGVINPDEEVIKEIPLVAGYSIPDYNVSLNCKVIDEATGIVAAPVRINFETEKYFVKLEDAGFQIEDANSDARIGPGEVVTVTVRIQNLGTSVAKNVRAKIRIGKSLVFTEDNDKREKIYDIGKLKPGEYKDEITFKIWANSSAPDTLPVYLTLSELYGKWGTKDIPIVLPFDSPNIAIKTLTVKGSKQSADSMVVSDFSIDIEQNIPETSQKNSDALAIIFGIEQYKNVSSATFAKRDAAIVKEYFNKTLGIPENRIYYKTDSDVGKAEFDKVFSKGGWLEKRVKEELTDIYVYYSGHGAPDMENKIAYLIPHDGDPNYASQTGYCIDNLYKNLSELNARKVYIFLDACFSGSNRENDMLLADARPILIKVNESSSNITENMSVFSAASARQTASAWPDKRHGLFTYFLLKGLKGNADTDQDKNLTIQELGDYIESNVSETAGMLDREQNPDIQTHLPNSILSVYK